MGGKEDAESRQHGNKKANLWWWGETMWTNSQIQLLALSARLTLCLLLGWPQDPLQFLFVFNAVTILPWFCFTGKP